ncbi:LysR family transcriptional regulator [Pseudomonas sp. OIL-1]|uniref:LysR family transcriptional regulator n=1 Tax=Pseudomonas sp. OIL-1 TaxID=2706126 RepID=UPI0013A797B3|nr:LysR family transcriptional regulator [Pseudomonas sp. OIL-1]QIB50094.1 LysR family transcriptional regulator [Pseudomonas sp. OIL-1]
MLNPVWLKSLVAIVQTGSFQSAARTLGLAQPTVSQHLQKLEEQVGVTLVHRSRSGCQPTTRALAFMRHATALLDMHDRALDALHGRRQRVGASSNIGTYLLQPFLRSYLGTGAEGGEVDLRIAANPDVADQLLAGQLDAAVMEWWIPHPDFEQRQWRVEPLVLIVGPDHPLAGAESIERARLVELPMLGGEPGSGTGRLLTEYFGELGVPRSGMQLGSTEAVKQAVRAGLGVSLVLASAVCDEVRSGTLVALPIPGLEKHVQLIWRKPPRNLPPPGFVVHLLETEAAVGDV